MALTDSNDRPIETGTEYVIYAGDYSKQIRVTGFTRLDKFGCISESPSDQLGVIWEQFHPARPNNMQTITNTSDRFLLAIRGMYRA